MDKSIFTEKAHIPLEEDLSQAIGKTYEMWKIIRMYVIEKYPNALEEWNFPGDKYGWSFRIKDKKRTIIYFLPRDGFFKVAFVFGQKATDLILNSPIDKNIKEELMAARIYAEGRGIRINIENEKIVGDIKKLVEIKLTY